MSKKGLSLPPRIRTNRRRRTSIFAFAQAERLEPRLVMSGVNVSTYHNDASSSGLNPAETTLGTNNVKVGSFGKLYQTTVDGAVYTQPLVQTGVTVASGVNTAAGAAGAHDIVLVATENDSVYALDTVSGAILWKRSFLDTTNPTGDTNNTLNATAITAIPYADTNSGDINPVIGITGTPVIDPTTQVAYVVANTKETIGGAAHYVQRLHAINLADGTDKVAPYLLGDTTNGNTNNTQIYDYGTGDGSVTDPYNGTGKPVVQFNALRENQRTGLDLENGSVYVEWASHGDNGPYHGWVTRFDVSNLSTAGIKLTGVLDTSPNGYEAGIWQGGGKLSFDSSGAFYLITGNGANGVPVTLNSQGLVSNADYYEAVIKVVSDPTSTPTSNNPNGWGLKVADFFIPYNSRNLDGADQDFGSGAPLVLPDSAGIPGHPHLLVAGGKQGVVYVIDRDNMGKFNATTDQVVSEQNVVGGVLGTPAFYNNEIYFLGDYSSNLRALALSSNGTLSIASQTNPAVNFSGLPGSPSISSNGTTGGIVWNLDRGGTNSLHAFDASDLSKELWNSNQAANGVDSFGYSVKFGTPTIANGEVFIGTNTNAVVAFGLKPPPNTAPAAPSNLAATAPSSTSVNLTWTDNSTNPNLATSFTIQDSTDNVNFSTVTTAAGGTTSITIGGLLSQTTYYFRIDASNGINASAYTKSVQVSTGTTTAQAPAAPTGLNGTPLTATSVSLNWTNNATNQTGFALDRATDSGFTQNLVTQNLPASPFSFTDSAAGLAPGGTYYYRIRATNGVGASNNSNAIPVVIPNAPAKPTNAAVTGVTSTEIDLSWTDNAGRTASGYNILRSTNNGTFSVYATLPASNLAPPSTYTWADTGVTPGTSYEYHIAAVNSSGNNDFAGANAEAITLAPSGLTPTLANGQVTLTWTVPVGALNYNIYRGTASGQETLYQSSITTTSYTDTTATAGTKYYYTVTAVNNNINHAPVLPSESAHSGEVSTPSSSTPPPAPLVNFPNGFASGTAGVLTLNHGAAIVGGNLQLTDGGTFESRTAYTTNTVPVGQFTTTFTFQIPSKTNAGDGFTFVVQGTSNSVYGGIGGSLGYASSVKKSLAVKFDLYSNSGEGPNSTGVYTNGAAPTNVGSIDMTSSGVNLHSGDTMTATISYDGSNLVESITDTVTHANFSHTYTGLNIPSLVGASQGYVGFTAGTGGSTATQNILSWTYSNGVSTQAITAHPPGVGPAGLSSGLGSTGTNGNGGAAASAISQAGAPGSIAPTPGADSTLSSLTYPIGTARDPGQGISDGYPAPAGNGQGMLISLGSKDLANKAKVNSSSTSVPHVAFGYSFASYNIKAIRSLTLPRQAGTNPL